MQMISTESETVLQLNGVEFVSALVLHTSWVQSRSDHSDMQDVMFTQSLIALTSLAPALNNNHLWSL